MKCRLLNLQSCDYNLHNTHTSKYNNETQSLEVGNLAPSFAWKLNFLDKLSNPRRNLRFFNQAPILIGELQRTTDNI